LPPTHAPAIRPIRRTVSCVRCPRGAGAAAALLLAVASAGAQRGKKDPQPEFTRQGLLIVNFAPHAGADMKLGRRAADAVRSRVGRFVDKKEVEIVDAGDVEYRMERAGYNLDTTFDMPAIRSTGKYFRADEFVMAAVANGPGGPRLSGALVLLRDERLRQPLPDAAAPKLDSAALLFARSIAAARAQLAPERRCENALRAGSGLRAVEAAREGVAASPRGAIVRTCLVWALRQNGAPATEVLAEAESLLAIDSVSPHGLEAAAVSLDSLRRREQAAGYWLRLAATDTSDLDLDVRIGYALLDGGNAARAEPFLTTLSDAHPDDIRFLLQRWRAAYENKHWPAAIAAGEALLQRDSISRVDSLFYYRLGFAYHSANKPLKAVETLAHGVSAFPNDARMYALYAQYVKAEADTAVPRGLVLFPQNATLLTMSAAELRTRGKIAEALDATRQAVALDGDLARGQGHLQIAQYHLELGRPDSAIAALHAGLASGEDSTLVATFALAKGNSLFQTAAAGTKTNAEFATALRMLAFSDSVRSSEQSRFLTGTAATAVAQTALLQSTKLSDKVEGCRLVRMATDAIPLARSGLHPSDSSYVEMAKPYLDVLDQIDPFAQQQIKLCAETDRPPPRP
jgi:tetratricopeptide (TPR) repeat protein